MSTASLADLTTLRVGGPIPDLVPAHSESEILEAVQRADAAGRPLLVLGGGSNILAADEPFEGVVVQDRRRGIVAEQDSACAGAVVRVPAGHPWDDLVTHAVNRGWSGIEALAGIPGSTGATPVQNVGAYGQEVAQVLTSVRTWDRQQNRIRTMVRSELQFGYRSSILKHTLHEAGSPWFPTPRFVVLDVQFQFPLGQMSAPVRYPELAAALGIDVGQRASARQVRQVVLGLRSGKGMVLDPADHDTWSAGSFFTNPVLTARAAQSLPPQAPRFPAGDGMVKTSAAWLITQSGVPRGYGSVDRAALSGKHALALTNRGRASAHDLRALAREVRDRVNASFGVVLEPEPVLLGGPL